MRAVRGAPPRAIERRSGGKREGLAVVEYPWYGIVFVISTAVILNGGYIYKLPSLKEGNTYAYTYASELSSVACFPGRVRERDKKREDRCSRSSLLGFLG